MPLSRTRILSPLGHPFIEVATVGLARLAGGYLNPAGLGVDLDGNGIKASRARRFNHPLHIPVIERMEPIRHRTRSPTHIRNFPVALSRPAAKVNNPLISQGNCQGCLD